MNLVKLLELLRVIWLNSVLLAATAGLRYSSACCASLLLPLNCAAEPRNTCCRPFRVGGLSVSKIWSRSTSLVVSLAAITPLLMILGAFGGPRFRAT